MLRKIIVMGAALSITSGMAFADTMVPYLGVEVGADKGNWKIKDVTSLHTNAPESGWFGNGFAGVGWLSDGRGYLGAEIFGGEGSMHTSAKVINTNTGTATAKIRMRYSYGASLLPGYRFTPTTMGFLRFGGIRSRFNFNQSVPPVGATSNLSKNTVSGGQIGVGLQANYDRWAVRGEYDYVAYRTFTVFDNKVTARDNQIKFGILYTIC